MTRSWDSIEPNSGHLAIVELQKLGKLKFLISQNVDNLHLKSGIRPDLLAELHGNRNKLRCVRCDETVDRSEGQTHRGCGGELVMINQGETPFDGVTNLRFHESIGEVLPKAVKRLKRLMGFFE
jgi:NAD-dependent SIR2 family protein deacetylase